MNTFSLHIEVVDPQDVKEVDGIQFRSCAFVQIRVDGEELLGREDFRGSCVYFPELEKSALASGLFLIFTCACGIADDAGWTEVKVAHGAGTVSWTLEREGQHHFVFALSQYREEIESCRRPLRVIPSGIVVEPRNVIFPE
jgi:hypothetical protein